MSKIQSVDEILKNNGFSVVDGILVVSGGVIGERLKAALTRREERIKVEAKIEVYKLVRPGVHYDVQAWIDRKVAELEQQLKALDGEDK